MSDTARLCVVCVCLCICLLYVNTLVPVCNPSAERLRSIVIPFSVLPSEVSACVVTRQHVCRGYFPRSRKHARSFALQRPPTSFTSRTSALFPVRRTPASRSYYKRKFGARADACHGRELISCSPPPPLRHATKSTHSLLLSMPRLWPTLPIPFEVSLGRYTSPCTTPDAAFCTSFSQTSSASWSTAPSMQSRQRKE